MSFEGFLDDGRIKDEDYIAQVMYDDVFKWPKLIQSKIKSDSLITVPLSSIVIVSFLRSRWYSGIDVEDNHTINYQSNGNSGFQTKIKLGNAEFSLFNERYGVEPYALRLSAIDSFNGAIENLGNEMSSQDDQTGFKLSPKDFIMEQSLGENNIFPRYNIMDDSVKRDISRHLKELNSRIKDAYPAGIKRVYTSCQSSLEHNIIVNNMGALVSYFLPKTSIYCEFELDTQRNLNEEKLSRLAGTAGPEVLFDLFDCKNGMNIDSFIEGVVRRAKDYIKGSKYIGKLGWSPNKTVPVILNPESSGFFIHEGIGHHVEIDLEDREYSADFFAKMIDSDNKVTPDFVNLSFNPGYKCDGKFIPNGYYVFDDEGVRGRNVDIIKDGCVVGMLNNLSYAKLYGLEPNGHCRGDSIRMSHMILDDSNALSLDEMIEGEVGGKPVKGNTYLITSSTGGQTEEVSKWCEIGISDMYFIDSKKNFIPVANYNPLDRDPRRRTKKEFYVRSSTTEVLNNIAGIAVAREPYEQAVFPSGTCGKDWEWVPVSESMPFILFNNMTITANNVTLEKKPFIEPYKLPKKK